MRACPGCQSTFPDSATTCKRDGLPLVERAVGVDLVEGCQLAGYRLGEILAEGRLGTVYRGSGLCRKPVAIKVLGRKVVSDPLALGAFVKEVYGVNGIGHPGIVDVCSVGLLDDGRCFVVMDWVDGVSLFQLMGRERRAGLNPGVSLSLLEQLCQIVGAAHDAGHLHLGLDPRRVFLLRCPPYPTVRVLGFGSACLADSSTAKARGSTLGGAVYTAPEQQAGRAADRRADVFSIGMLFYEMITGRYPLNPDDSGLKRLASVGNGLTKVTLKALARDPSARYGSTARLLAAAQEAYQSPGGDADGDVETQVSGPPRFRDEPAPLSVIGEAPADEHSTHVSLTLRTERGDDEEPTATEPGAPLFPTHSHGLPGAGRFALDTPAPAEPRTSTRMMALPEPHDEEPATDVGEGLEFATGSGSGLFGADVRPLPSLSDVLEDPEVELDEGETRRYRQGDTIEMPPGDHPDDEPVAYDEHDTRPFGPEHAPVARKPVPGKRSSGEGVIPAGPLDDTYVEGAGKPPPDDDGH